MAVRRRAPGEVWFVKVVRLAAIIVGTLVIAASPAGATPTVATDQKFWFYWIAPLLLLGFVGFLGALAAGYYVRVIRPKQRGRPVDQ
jgi:hypothetical protein